MSEHPTDSSQNRFRATVAGALTFVSFGLLAGLVLWIAGFKTGAQRTEKGQFTPERIAVRATNLETVKQAQAAVFDAKKVAASMKAFSGNAAKKTAIVIPGSATDLKNQAAAAAKVVADKAAAEKAIADKAAKKAAAEKAIADKAAAKKAAAEKAAADKKAAEAAKKNAPKEKPAPTEVEKPKGGAVPQN